MKRFFILSTVLLCLLSCGAEEYSLFVENPSDIERSGEILEVEIAEAESLVVYDASGVELPSQVTYEGKLLFPVTVPANGSSSYTLKRGERSPIDTVVVGRMYPERLDDIAWENDRIGFRTYGKEAGKDGSKFYGYDIFTKRGEEPVLDYLYEVECDLEYKSIIKELRAQGDHDGALVLQSIRSYHLDHGSGMDYYVVGPTLGCGTAALIQNGKNVYVDYYDTYEILDKGGLRFTMKLTYDPMQIGDDTVVEERIITLDAASHFNRVEVNYRNLTKPSEIIVGLVMRDEGEQHQITKGSLAYAEPVHKYGWQTYDAVLYPEGMTATKNLFDEQEKAAHGGAFGYVQVVGTVQPSEPFVYYMGAGWNRWGFKTPQDWFDYVAKCEAAMQQPLTYTIK